MELPDALLDAGFHVFITTGADINDFGDTAILGPRESYGLWHFIDGTIDVYEGDQDIRTLPASAWQRLPTDRCYLTRPKQQIMFRVPRGARHRRVSFAVRHGPRQSGQGKTRFPADGIQPQPVEFFHTDLPFAIPQIPELRTTWVLEQCCRLWWRSVLNRLQANHYLHGWLLQLLEYCCQDQDEKGHPNDHWLLRLEQHCQDQLPRGLTVADLAKVSACSTSTFKRRLRKSCQLSPSEFLNKQRAIAAQRALSDPQRDLAAVAGACGFANRDSFRRWYIRHFGQAPR